MVGGCVLGGSSYIRLRVLGQGGYPLLLSPGVGFNCVLLGIRMGIWIAI